MKKICYLYLFFIMLSICIFFTTQTVSASEYLPTEAMYDLELGGTQNFVIYDKLGNSITLTIEELSGINRVDNGTYKITYDSKPCWKAGFYVVISNNCITSVKDAFYTLYMGAMYSDTLVKDSTKQASYHLKYKYDAILYNTGVRASITGTTLKAYGI